MKTFTVKLLLAASLLLMVLGCSKESAVHGKWSRDDDAVIIELLKDKTGVITANNVKIYKKRGMEFPSDVQLEQKMRCKWSLSGENELSIEEVDSPTPNKLKLKLEGDTLSKDGKVVYVRKKS
jgi:hypothetical protein